MIEVRNLTKRFGGKKAVDDISFTVSKGEILGFLGPNGAGKTTTMRMLSCYFSPTRGSIKIGGFELNEENSIKIRKLIGYMPENVPIYPEFRVNQSLEFTAEVKGMKNAAYRKKRINEVIELCGLKEVYKQITGTLSKGYRQRLGIAQTLLNDPEILILDEPTAGLDPRQIIEIRNLIKSFKGNKTVILSTHILPEVEGTCSRVIIINNGKIAAMDTPDNLTKQIEKSMRIYLEVEGKPVIVKEALANLRGIKTVSENEKLNDDIYTYWVEADNDYTIKKEISRSLAGKDTALLEMRTHTMSMEDIFVHLVTKEQT